VRACGRLAAGPPQRPAADPEGQRLGPAARQDSFRETVAGFIKQTGIDPAWLCLEVTESVLIEDPESSIRVLTELKELGIRIAIDDFGTGYSSVDYPRRLPVDCVKIDRSFVRGLPDNEEDVAIVNAVIELGHALKPSVTAEGVETADQLGNLQTAGCDTAHGFPFYRPEPPEVLEQLFADDLAATDTSAVAARATEEQAVPAAAPVDGGRAPAPQRRLIPPPGVRGSRRRLARHSLVAGVKAMTDTWVTGGTAPDSSAS
jgi:EAL domain